MSLCWWTRGATTAAIRNAFETFLKGRAGKKDTVMLFLAGHGTVEAAGNKGAYIVTYDSDPQDLAVHRAADGGRAEPAAAGIVEGGTRAGVRGRVPRRHYRHHQEHRR